MTQPRPVNKKLNWSHLKKVKNKFKWISFNFAIFMKSGELNADVSKTSVNADVSKRKVNIAFFYKQIKITSNFNYVKFSLTLINIKDFT